MPKGVRLHTASLISLAVMATALGCGGEDSSSSPSAPTSGAPTVRGTERLAWAQAGDVSRLRFRAYVDGAAVDLTAATCNSGSPEAECSSPLPTLTNGVHTIAVVNVTAASGAESERTNTITVQKLAQRSIVAATLPMASARPGALRLDSEVAIADGLAFTADIVATGVRGPVQLAWVADGRLLVSDADRQVRVVRPGEAGPTSAALDIGLLSTRTAGPMGIASHPGFAQNRFVYVSFLERDGSDRTVIRVVRVREAGDTLGEPAALYLAPVAPSATADTARADEAPLAAPRMAFGPDRLLYVMLPPGFEVVDDAAASTPRGVLLRLSDDGTVPTAGPLSGITSSALGFTWHPGSGALWMIEGTGTTASVRSFGTGERGGSARPERGVLVLQASLANRALAKALVPVGSGKGGWVARLALPAQTDAGAGMLDRIGDVVGGADGTLFAATANAVSDPGSGAGREVVVRLTPAPARH